MFTKNPVAKETYAELSKSHPHPKWHYVLLCLAFAVSIAFLIQGGITDNYRYVYSVVLFVVLTYWFFQFQVMNAAVKLSQLGYLPTQSISPRRLALARIKAILWHYRYHLIILLVTMFAAMLSLTEYLHFFDYGQHYPQDLLEKRGIMRYIGAIPTGYGKFYDSFAHLMFGKDALIVLTIFSLSSSILSISIGLWARRLARARLTAIVIITLALLAFFVLFGIRNTEPYDCNRRWSSRWCEPVLLEMRLLDSFQSMAFTFIDGGITSSSGLAGVGHYCWWRPSHTRQILSVMSALSIQILLIFTFLGNSYSTKQKR